MLIKPPIEQLLPKVESRYTLAMLVAKRTRQLVDGAQPMAEADSPNLVTMACEEIAHDKVVCVTGIHNPVVPLRPEIEEARRLAREMAANQASLDAFPDLMDLSVKGADEQEIYDATLDGDLIPEGSLIMDEDAVYDDEILEDEILVDVILDDLLIDGDEVDFDSVSSAIAVDDDDYKDDIVIEGSSELSETEE
jgi:DNA-directed RNA polymerase omega subunit